jgi:hypothetical protein
MKLKSTQLDGRRLQSYPLFFFLSNHHQCFETRKEDRFVVVDSTSKKLSLIVFGASALRMSLDDPLIVVGKVSSNKGQI